jgi:hypothetical protein
MRNEIRCRRLVEGAIGQFSLNLQDHIVLTEAATGYYILTPLIAALAGAKRVYALAGDSIYGTAQEASAATVDLAQHWDVKDRIVILFSRGDDRIGAADIVTNLGFVRPLDPPFLKQLKHGVVIPLMWETWEYRSEDLDLKECRRLSIPVAGTNEHHSSVNTLYYVGKLAIKLLFELDIEVFRAHVLVVGGGEFGRTVCEALTSNGAHVAQIQVIRGESLKSQKVQELVMNADALVMAEHQSREVLIGLQGQITAEELRALNPALVIAHISGGVNDQDLRSAGIPYLPKQSAPPGYMSVATDYLGPRPLVDLHTAGLKVGQAMAQAVHAGYSGTAAEERASQLCPLVMRFT